MSVRAAGVTLRGVGLAVAAGVAVVGILGAFTSAVSVPDLLGTQSRVLLAIVGLAWGLLVAKRWTEADLGGYRPPERERVAPVPAPGEDVDELLALGEAAGGETGRYYRSRGRDRLLELGVRTLVVHRGLAPEAAHRRLREGTWTDDPDAAAFFRLRGDAGAADALGGAIGASVGREHPNTRRARRAVAELRRIAEASA